MTGDLADPAARPRAHVWVMVLAALALSCGQLQQGGSPVLPQTHRVLCDTGVITTPDGLPTEPASPAYKGAEYQTRVPIEHFDWTEPINFAGGRVHQRVEVIAYATDTRWRANQQLQEPGYNGDHWWPGGEWIVVEGPGVYTTDHDVQSMRDARGLKDRFDDPPELRLALAVQGQDWNMNAPWDEPRIYPMTLRVIWVVVAEGEPFIGWDAVLAALDGG